MNNVYPHVRVIVFFTLCPFFSGLIYGLLGVGAAILYNDGYAEYKNLAGFIGILFALPVGGAFTGLIYFGVPALIASIVYSVFRLHKSWCSYLLVTITGGMCAHLWIPVIFRSKYGQWEITDIFHAIFLLGALSSLLTAYFVLPSKYSVVLPTRQDRQG